MTDGADLSHTNLGSPQSNQLHISWTANGEWCNDTVHVARPGTHRNRIKSLQAFQTHTVTKDPPNRPPQRQTHGITRPYPAPRRIRRMESNRSRAAARCRSRSLRCLTSRVTSSGRTLRLTF